jgi:hypothetical protein
MKKPAKASLRAAVVTLLAACLMPAGARAEAQKDLEPPPPSRVAKAFDVLVVRPFGLLVIPVGIAAFIPTALLSAPGGMDNLREAYDHFVSSPVSFVFQRPLGEI